MGTFGTFKTPLRAIGNLARRKSRNALGNFGETAQIAAPAGGGIGAAINRLGGIVAGGTGTVNGEPIDRMPPGGFMDGEPIDRMPPGGFMDGEPIGSNLASTTTYPPPANAYEAQLALDEEAREERRRRQAGYW